MVKATVVSKKCENAENKFSSADTIKPYNSVIHGHRSTYFLIKVEKQIVLFAGMKDLPSGGAGCERNGFVYYQLNVRTSFSYKKYDRFG